MEPTTPPASRGTSWRRPSEISRSASSSPRTGHAARAVLHAPYRPSDQRHLWVARVPATLFEAVAAAESLTANGREQLRTPTGESRRHQDTHRAKRPYGDRGGLWNGATTFVEKPK